jgi:hypothetical protein
MGKLVGSLLIRSNDIALQADLNTANDGPPVQNRFGSINDFRSDMTFNRIPLRKIVGPDVWASHKRLVMRCTQFSLFTGDQMTANSERALTVVLSGHNPANREWRSCNTQSDVCYLCTRKDTNLSTQSVPEEKSINYADQVIELATDYIDLRIRFTLLTASGSNTVLLPISTGSDRKSFPHSLFHFQLLTED